MKTGRRIANPVAKKLANTYRADRHADITTIAIVASAVPMAPVSLSIAAQSIWAEELPRVIATGVTETDSSLFARYCEMEAFARATFTDGELPKLALLTELRRTAELLGIAGLRSRLARSGAPESKATSPFSVRTN